MVNGKLRLGLEDAIPPKANVDLVGDYKPLPFRGNGFTKGQRPQDLMGK